VVICLSHKSITKEGYIQKEIKFALDSADEKPEGTIFLIPARLEECVVPDQLGRWQWVDLFDETGYERLLRSLERRAEKVGAIIGAFGENEIEQRSEQLYTDGLAAFYTEDWDKAYTRFKDFLRERPNHPQAAQKLEQVIQQRKLKALYTQALESQKSEDWQTVVTVLEKLTNEVADYKDAAALLKIAQKKKQLIDLYNEARRLHKAEQWQAVIVVLAKISAIDPNYPDVDRLKDTANQRVAESARHAELNELYSRAVRELDSGNWQTAYKLLKRIQRIHFGFLETERLLVKVEDEIKKIKKPTEWSAEKFNIWKRGKRARILLALFVSGIFFLFALGILLWRGGVPIPMQPNIDKDVFIFSEAESKSSTEFFQLRRDEFVYLCKYDVSSTRYLIAKTFWGCKSSRVSGWIYEGDVANVYLINFLYKQP